MNQQFKYKPIPVKELLREMKDLSELMIDLAYYSVLYNDLQLATEVFELEERINYLQTLLNIQATLATRDVSTAEKMVSIYAIASATRMLASAATEIARVARKRFRIPKEFIPLMCGEEDFVTAFKYKEPNEVALSELFKRTGVIIDVIAIRRGKQIILEPKQDFKLKPNDIVIVKGPFNNVVTFCEKLGRNILNDGNGEDCSDARYESIINMLLLFRRVSKVCIDLAYVAVLTRSDDVALKVKELEAYTDTLLDKFSEDILKEKMLSNHEKLGALWIAIASENIADAAVDMVEPLLKGLEPHPILTDIIKEADERISVIEMDEEDEGKTLADLGYTRRGISILAVRRGDDWYILPSKTTFKVKKGDILIVKYSSELEPFVEQLEKEEDRLEIIEEIQEEEWEE